MLFTRNKKKSYIQEEIQKGYLEMEQINLFLANEALEAESKAENKPLEA